jgi:hypothetical protein
VPISRVSSGKRRFGTVTSIEKVGRGLERTGLELRHADLMLADGQLELASTERPILISGNQPAPRRR